MTRRKPFFVIIAALLLVVLLMVIIVGRGRSNAVPTPADAVLTADPVTSAESAEPSDVKDEPVSPSEPAEPSPAEPGRRDGERFEEVIILEGMEETVRYEHIRNEELGFEMDYDYESFVRRSGSLSERFVSIYDDPQNPEYYLEVRYSAQDADAVASAIAEALSRNYEISRDDSFMLDRAGRCIRIDASADIGGKTMPDRLQTVYIIPAADGSRVATVHTFIEGAEGFGRRFRYLMDTFSVIPAAGENRISDEQALAAVRNYCHANDPNLESIEEAGEYPVYWEVSSGSEHEIVVLFRSYTGAQIRFYIDPVSGEAYVTEFVPGITSEEMRTGESLNLWYYSF